jgi:hypothetical protein
MTRLVTQVEVVVCDSRRCFVVWCCRTGTIRLKSHFVDLKFEI